MLLQALRGNWLGALLVAIIPIVVSLALSTALSLVLAHDRSQVGDVIKGGVLEAFSSLGAPIHLLGPERATILDLQLTITVLAFGAAALTFHVVTRRYQSRAIVLVDAARAAVVFAVLLTVAGIVLRIAKPTFARADGAGQSYAPPSVLGIGSGGSYHLVPSLPWAIVVPFVILLVVLTASALRLRIANEEGALARVHEIMRSPLTALAALVWLTVPAAAVYLGSMYLQDGYRFDARGLTADAANLPGAGVHVLGLGFGGSLGQAGGGESYPRFHLNRLADNLHWLIWFSIPVAILVVIGVTLIALMRTPARSALWSALAYLGLLVCALAALGVVSNFNSWYSGGGDHHHFSSGINLLPLVGASTGTALVVGALVLLITGRMIPRAAAPPTYGVPPFGASPFGGPLYGAPPPAAPPYQAPAAYPPTPSTAPGQDETAVRPPLPPPPAE